MDFSKRSFHYYTTSAEPQQLAAERESTERTYEPVSREMVYASSKQDFEREWREMGNGKDATKRYALAKLIQAAFVTVVGPRGECEEMSWTADLRRPESGGATSGSVEDDGRRESTTHTEKSGYEPSREGSVGNDYPMLRMDFAAIYLNRVKGEEPEEVERVAGVFREAWAREMGDRADDFEMPWDEVAGKEGGREVVGWGVEMRESQQQCLQHRDIRVDNTELSMRPSSTETDTAIEQRRTAAREGGEG
ncbi:hypothetical protein V492_02226 [Pseudogymnoascus sp. VKM F-4246]|nr:hypothetical protein V492_02226 [Pseudogymnoascus sp. VKM F-4246]